MWQDEALCKGMDVKLFFPDVPADQPNDPSHKVAEQYERMREYCKACPVREECLTHAMTTRIMDEHVGEPDGMWGGTTPAERMKHRKLFQATGTIPWSVLASRKTHCRQGHPYGDSTRCYICDRANRRRYEEKKRGERA